MRMLYTNHNSPHWFGYKMSINANRTIAINELIRPIVRIHWISNYTETNKKQQQSIHFEKRRKNANNNNNNINNKIKKRNRMATKICLFHFSICSFMVFDFSTGTFTIRTHLLFFCIGQASEILAENLKLLPFILCRPTKKTKKQRE